MVGALIVYFSIVIVPISANFLPHDFIETSVRIQTIDPSNGRNSSSWFQLEGSKAPVFGVQRHALISIPRECDSLQLAFDHQRFVTPWLKLSGSAVHKVRNPVVHVELTRSGPTLLGAHGNVYSYKKNTGMAGGMEIHESKQFMNKLFQEFYDISGESTKRVLVKYTFRTKHETDLGMSVLVLMAIGVLVAGMMALSTFLAYRRELMEFYTDIVQETGASRDGAANASMSIDPSLSMSAGVGASGDMGMAATASSVPMFQTATSGYVRQQRAAVGIWQQQGQKAD